MNPFFHQLNLTGRILVSFWVTLVLVIVSAGVLFAMDSDETYTEDIKPPTIIPALAERFFSQSYEDTQSWLAEQPRKEQRRVYVLRNGEEILDRSLPRPVRYMMRQLSEQRSFIHKQRHHKIAVGRYIKLPDGSQIKLVALVRAPKPHWRAIMMDNLLWVLILSIVISGLISYILARYISRPIRSLRQATQQIASGDLSARVLPGIRRHKDEMYRLAEDFDHMAEKLERSIDSQKRLIQDISHELRSPIARLQIALELARKRLQQTEQQDLDRIEIECQQLNDIIATLLNLPSYELQPDMALNDQVDIEALLETLCDDLNYSEASSPIQLISDLKEPVVIKANGQLLRSALENVLKNAQHYSENSEPVRVQLKQRQDINGSEALEIQCCDNGPGVPENKITEIFKPFYRTSEARERSSGGHGLGLAIAKRAIDLHHGDISARNIKPKGLCISVQLPMTP